MKISAVLAMIFVLRAVRSCDNGGNLKNVGQHCEDNSECYSGGNTDAVSCKAGVCECNDGYEPQLQWFTPKEQRLVCLPLPYRDQPCTTACQKPFVCVDSSTPGIKTCQCRFPFVSKDGWCFRECEPDEVFEYGECKKRCEDDESKGDRGVCKKMGKLGEPCETKNECWAPFSQCINGVCSCAHGFEPNRKKDVCQSMHRWCPVGHPILTKANKIVECNVTKKQNSPGVIPAAFLPFPRPTNQLEDNCGADQFCMLTSGEGYYAEGAIGHCCPKPKLNCPIGLPHPNATCGQPVPDRAASSDPSPPYCPYGSYSCIRFAFGGGYETSLCCPTACGSNQVLSNGTCYPRRNHGDRCQIDEQCRGHSGTCETGRCACGSGYVTEGSLGYKYCRRVCKANEVAANNDRCVPKLKLGDKCDPQIYNQCPTNAYCSDKKVCDCFCGYVKLADDSCAPQPSCPAIEASKKPSFLDVVKVATLTLCHAPGASGPSRSSVAETCPKGQYCASYVPEYGLCCPMPVRPFCSNGAIPGEKCDPKQSNPCGPLAYCNRYLDPAGNDSDTGYVCCPVAGPVSISALLNQTQQG